MVSIHAPAGFDPKLLPWVALWMFQFTHPRGNGKASARGRSLSIRFNPHIRMGCDGQEGLCRKRGTRFNARIRVGMRLEGHMRGVEYVKFQFTHPRGMQPRSHPDSPAFQLTHSCVGCDVIPRKPSPWFQFTHPRGMRDLPFATGGRRFCVSIHAPAWDVTHTTY